MLTVRKEKGVEFLLSFFLICQRELTPGERFSKNLVHIFLFSLMIKFLIFLLSLLRRVLKAGTQEN